MPVNRLWQLGAALVALGALALGWFLGVSPALDARATSTSQLASLQSANDQTALRIAKLAKDKQQLPQLQQQLAGLLTSVPTSADIPDFVNQINAAASQSGVTVTSIGVSDATPFQPVAPPAGSAAPTASSTTATGSTPTPSPSPTVAPGMPPVTDALVDSKSMAVIPVDIAATGTLTQSLDFVKAMQSGARLYLVTKVATNPLSGTETASTGQFTVTLSGTVYTLTKTTSQPAATK